MHVGAPKCPRVGRACKTGRPVSGGIARLVTVSRVQLGTCVWCFVQVVGWNQGVEANTTSRIVEDVLWGVISMT